MNKQPINENSSPSRLSNSRNQQQIKSVKRLPQTGNIGSKAASFLGGLLGLLAAALGLRRKKDDNRDQE